MNIIEQNRQSYNAIAREFSQSRSALWTDNQYFFKYIKAGDRILDAGCGNGRLSEGLPEGVEYLGIDNSENLIAEARKHHPRQTFEVADLLNWPADYLTSASFDVVFLLSALNHFPEEYQSKVLANLKKFLKPGGYLLMLNWNLWNVRNRKGVWYKKHIRKQESLPAQAGKKAKKQGVKDVMTTWKRGDKEAPLYYYAFTKKEIARLLKKNGFEIVKNFYIKNGKRSFWLLGYNIATVARAI